MKDKAPNRAERWVAGPSEEPVLRLEIPADLQREREFEISVALTVRALDVGTPAWHELRVFANGQLEWSRRIATARDAPYDGLDMRFRRVVAPGRPLSLLAQCDCGAARRLRLVIEAEET